MYAALNPLDSTSLLSSAGAVGVFLVLFGETGLLSGLFLPDDSLLFTARPLSTANASGRGHPSLILAVVAGALAGVQTEFWLGRRGGRALLARTTYQQMEGTAGAQCFLARYGQGSATVPARFVPVARTVLTLLVGASGVPAGTFVLWRVNGELLWAAGVIAAGYLLGSSIPGVDRPLLPIVGVIVVVSLVPVALEMCRSRRSGAASEPRDRDGAGDR